MNFKCNFGTNVNFSKHFQGDGLFDKITITEQALLQGQTRIKQEVRIVKVSKVSSLLDYTISAIKAISAKPRL